MATEKREIKSEYIIDVGGAGFESFQVIAVLSESLVARCKAHHVSDYLSVRSTLRADTRNEQLFARIPEGERESYLFTRRARDI